MALRRGVSWARNVWWTLSVAAAVCVANGVCGAASAQDRAGGAFEDQIVSKIELEGLSEVNRQLVENQIRMRVGDPNRAAVREGDVRRLNFLVRFRNIVIAARPDPERKQTHVILTYQFVEAPTLADVQFVGNRALTDQELAGVLILRPGDPVEEFAMDRGIQQIKRLYQSEGYFAASVRIDEELLRDERVLLVRIVEGPRVRVKAFQVEGNTVFPDALLLSQVRSRTYIWLLRKGDLNLDQLEQDVARIRDFLRERGYLDGQVGREIQISPDGLDAVVRFVVEEGRQYRVGNVTVRGNQQFTDEQVRLQLELSPGAAFNVRAIERSQRQVRLMYGDIGYIDTTVRIDRLFDGDNPVVDLLVTVEEGTVTRVGKVIPRGNELTQTRILLRELRGLEPGRPFNLRELDRTRRRIANSTYFQEGVITILGQPGDEVRDVLVEVKETNTGRIGLGVGVSSDVGLIGEISVTQRNFDILDSPETLEEFFSNRAFRGGGQLFELVLQPGDEFNRYSVRWRDPFFLESDYFLDLGFSFFNQEREDFDEGRITGRVGVGRRFGDIWSASLAGRIEQIDISNIDNSAPVDVFDVQGESVISALAFGVSRSTLDSPLNPTRGSRVEALVSQIGVFGGDYDFTKLSLSGSKYWTIDEDYLGRKTVFFIGVETGYIPQDGEAPIFERFFAGGHRSLRGFANRGAGPRGVQPGGGLSDQFVGGQFSLVGRGEYVIPVQGDVIRWAFFSDMGTVLDDPGVEDWRLSVGTGIRLKVPFFGQAPFAIDLAFPLLKEPDDDDQLFSFDLAIPFR
ncbi:MAG: outer membrane protein assembly factor [Planctomycetota bacterium]